MKPIARTGIDLIEVSRLEELNPAIRRRFLRRVFTDNELAECTHPETGLSLVSLAGRFAVKEAVAKALGCGIGPIAWQEIETRRGPQGEPALSLHGRAAGFAADLGLQTWSISISHTATTAAAVAVAIGFVKE